MKLFIHTDGGARGNPGPAASAFFAENEKGDVLYKEENYIGITTNNVAEYTALLMALRWAHENVKKLEIESVEILMDSELVVKQMNHLYKVKNEGLFPLHKEATRIIGAIGIELKFTHIKRAANSEADKMVNTALDNQK